MVTDIKDHCTDIARAPIQTKPLVRFADQSSSRVHHVLHLKQLHFRMVYGPMNELGGRNNLVILDLCETRIQIKLERLSRFRTLKRNEFCALDFADTPIAHFKIRKIIIGVWTAQHVTKPPNKIVIRDMSSKLPKAKCKSSTIICIDRQKALPFANCRRLNKVCPEIENLFVISRMKKVLRS